MSQDDAYPILDTILHPSDFSEASEVAFAHALKAAFIARARLTLLHVSPDPGPNGVSSPGCGARWNAGA